MRGMRGSGRFEHNFTFAAHPIATAVGSAVIRILRRERLVERVASLEERFFKLLRDSLSGLPIVGDIRGMGLLAGVELVADRRTRRPFPVSAHIAARATHYALAEGLIVYPCGGGVDGEAGDYLLLAPPCVTSEADLERMTALLDRALAQLGKEIE
jgi:adenosylmethionine-8-amino-7-oxononanoate aminotransferase